MMRCWHVQAEYGGRPKLPAAGTGPQAACPAAERATGREAARSAADLMPERAA
ncbi:hypothetical protein N5079_28555 [Planotetraspora sp. A-T 1434]|uniref:hypothetical protein n=1 Tax=Planotetraspora sp. A-T 1434 TaxID=2979219 RepID=UPI0021BF4705|nr:hypothetical protein [Planotetraspora sp. A-T 1434]MCT9934162.1 hypothetical protein [Planotetraspora sp. A-T 1434]